MNAESDASEARPSHDLFRYAFESTVFEAPLECAGTGPYLLCLPALSTVSSREEMRPLAQALGDMRRTVLTDWPGFGETTRHPVRYGPALLGGFLDALLAHLGREGPVDMLAAGHAAAYAVAASRRADGRVGRLALVAPTWRGPLPTAMGRHDAAYARVRSAVHLPVLGHLLYRLNTMESVIGLMYRRHVYAEQALVTKDFVSGKARHAHRRNARFGSAAFVTGALDPFPDRESFHAALSRLDGPVLAVTGRDTPPKSLAEMRALGRVESVRTVEMAGSLGMHEENAAAIAPILRNFLAADAPATAR